MMRYVFVMMGLIGVMMLGGCETIEGAGRDLQKAGEAVQRAAD